jgi:hypothetical protein
MEQCHYGLRELYSLGLFVGDLFLFTCLQCTAHSADILRYNFENSKEQKASTLHSVLKKMCSKNKFVPDKAHYPLTKKIKTKYAKELFRTEKLLTRIQAIKMLVGGNSVLFSGA